MAEALALPSAPAPYCALALQTRCQAVNRLDAEAARHAMRAAIAKVAEQVSASKAFIGPDTRLVVLPEYFLTGFPMGESIPDWAEKACLEMDGEEYEALGRICQDNDVFLSGNAYELDRHFPGLYFQTSFILAPNGEVIHRYRRLLSMFAPTPHDVWDRYLEIYGVEGVFPVTDTAVGRLATVASEEILYPEIARALALRGAEVLLHSTSEAGSPALTTKEAARRARAVENQAYVVSANSAGVAGTGMPEESTDGMSKLVDFHGRVLAAAGPGESIVAHHELDLAALRRFRRRPGMANLLARQRLELYAHIAPAQTRHPANTLLDEAGAPVVPPRRRFMEIQREVIAALVKQNLI